MGFRSLRWLAVLGLTAGTACATRDPLPSDLPKKSQITLRTELSNDELEEIVRSKKSSMPEG